MPELESNILGHSGSEFLVNDSNLTKYGYDIYPDTKFNSFEEYIEPNYLLAHLNDVDGFSSEYSAGWYLPIRVITSGNVTFSFCNTNTGETIAPSDYVFVETKDSNSDAIAVIFVPQFKTPNDDTYDKFMAKDGSDTGFVIAITNSPIPEDNRTVKIDFWSLFLKNPNYVPKT